MEAEDIKHISELGRERVDGRESGEWRLEILKEEWESQSCTFYEQTKLHFLLQRQRNFLKMLNMMRMIGLMSLITYFLRAVQPLQISKHYSKFFQSPRMKSSLWICH